jgi:hypothetical protein
MRVFKLRGFTVPRGVHGLVWKWTFRSGEAGKEAEQATKADGRPAIAGARRFETPAFAVSRFANWPAPSLALAKGSWLGGMELANVFPVPFSLNQDCQPVYNFPQEKQMAALVDAFLYLGPSDLRLAEPICC